MLIRSHWRKSWSKIQSFTALSSAESEVHVSMKTAAEASGFQSMASDFRTDPPIRALADASGASGIGARRGGGNARHLDANHLWIQEVSAKKRAKYEKVLDTSTPVDLTTKEVNQGEFVKYVEFIGVRYPASGLKERRILPPMMSEQRTWRDGGDERSGRLPG